MIEDMDLHWLNRELAIERERDELLAHYETFHPAKTWTIRDGVVLWWRLPLVDDPFVGMPGMNHWLDHYDEHYTHWTRLVRTEVLHGILAKYLEEKNHGRNDS